MFKKFLLTLLTSISTVYAADIEFIVHHGPGGPSDKITRLISQESSKKYLVVNRPGAQGKIAVRHLLTSDSMMVATMPQIFATNFMMSGDPGYQEDDLEILAIVGVMPNLLVCNNKHNFKNFNEFVNTSKSLNFGVAGYGSSEHLATEVLLRQFKNTHVVVPYAQGGAVSLTDLLAGNIDCMFANYPLVKEHINNSKITALISSHNLNLSVTTWSKEFKSPFPFQSQLGLVVSKNLDNSLKSQIVSDIGVVFQTQSFKEEVLKLGLFPILSTSPKVIQDSLSHNTSTKSLIKKFNLKLN